MNQLSKTGSYTGTGNIEWKCYSDMDKEISDQIGNISSGFIYLGYLFKKARDTELFKEAGYTTIYEYTLDKYNITRTQALRFMQINDKYSIGGNSPDIEPQYIGYGSSKLTEMLGIPEEIRNEIPPEITVKELRSIKADLAADNEQNSQVCDVTQTLENTCDLEDFLPLKKLILTYFKDAKKEYKNYHDILKNEDPNERLTQDKLFNIIAPSKFKMVRTEGYNAIINEAGIKMMPLAAGNQMVNYTHDDFMDEFCEVFDINEASESWEFIYKEPFETKEEVKKEIPKVEPVEETKSDDEEESLQVEEITEPEIKEDIEEEPLTAVESQEKIEEDAKEEKSEETEIIPEEDITIEEDIKETVYPDEAKDIKSSDIKVSTDSNVSTGAAVDMEYKKVKATLILEIETGLSDPEMATEETLRYLVEQDLEDMGYVVSKCEIVESEEKENE